MKNNLFCLIIVLVTTSGISVHAENRTEKINVNGKCEMCKTRIESAVKSLNGINSAMWDKETKKLEVMYENHITTSQRIQTSIAMAGHDTEMFRANDKKYAELPGCCKYHRNENRKKVDHDEINSGYNMKIPANSGCDHDISETSGSCCEK